MIILASQSEIRRNLMMAAGITFTAIKSPLDEAALHHDLKHLSPLTLAQTLATAKAKALVAPNNHDIVIGVDQTSDFDGRVLHKPKNRAEAKQHLVLLSGKTHQLHTAYTLTRAQNILAQHCQTSSLTMRTLSDSFIETYLDGLPKPALTSVGCYQLEGLGIQLMDHIDGDYFSILGLPLLPLLAHLRQMGEMPS